MDKKVETKMGGGGGGKFYVQFFVKKMLPLKSCYFDKRRLECKVKHNFLVFQLFR
jgi:hypothetical protein